MGAGFFIITISSLTKNEGYPFTTDRPRPVSRKTSEDGVKKSFLFEPQASLKDFSRRTLIFRAKRAQP
jgi:hypothetical protein